MCVHLKALCTNSCTQIYFINLEHEQINGKPTRKDKISTNVKAFRFVYLEERLPEDGLPEEGLDKS